MSKRRNNNKPKRKINTGEEPPTVPPPVVRPPVHATPATRIGFLRPMVPPPGRVVQVKFVAAQPKDEKQLDTNHEYMFVKQIWNGTDHASRSSYHVTDPALGATSELFQSVLQEAAWPTILHYAGHGGTDGKMVLEAPDRSSQQVDRSSAAGLLKAYSGRLWAVVLNACHSESLCELLAEDVPYVIGIRGEVYDPDAMKFSRHFYRALFSGKCIEQAYQEGCHLLPDEQQPILYVGRGVPPSRTPLLLKVAAAVAAAAGVVGMGLYFDQRGASGQLSADLDRSREAAAGLKESLGKTVTTLEEAKKGLTEANGRLKSMKVKPVAFDTLAVALGDGLPDRQDLRQGDLVQFRGYIRADNSGPASQLAPWLWLVATKDQAGTTNGPGVEAYLLKPAPVAGHLNGRCVTCVGRLDRVGLAKKWGVGDVLYTPIPDAP